MIQPRITGDYYRSLDPIGQRCFRKGMPLEYCKDFPESMTFRNEKIAEGKSLSTAEQTKFFNTFKKTIPTEPHVTLFVSPDTDHLALCGMSQLLKAYMKEQAWDDFEFVSINEQLPEDSEDIKGLYCLMGAKHGDSTQWVRKWVRSRLGTPIWISVTAPSAVAWYREELGIKPNFLFSFKNAGRQIG